MRIEEKDEKQEEFKKFIFQTQILNLLFTIVKK
jgi:hypothetical protein